MVVKSFIRYLPKLLREFYYKLLPPICVFCGLVSKCNHAVCAACEQDLPGLPPSCRQCGRFLSLTQTELRCGACLKSPPPYDAVFALFPYEPPLVQLMIKLKFQSQLSHATLLSRWLLQQILSSWYAKKRLPDLILPVPLHRKRLRQRGFNQALLLARPIANALCIPMAKGVIRHKNTQAQSGLSAKERRLNIANAFMTTHRFDGLMIAVIDDVMTTGATMNALCQLLKQKGAEIVHVWCAARAG